MSRRLTTDLDIAAARRFSTCELSDALDRLEVSGAPHGLLPLWPGCPRIVGPAYTMRLVPRGARSPVRGTLEAVAAAPPGSVLVIDHGGRTEVNSWGGIATFTAVRRRLAGVVIDGATRDVDEIRALSFPAFGRGIVQQSVRGRCAFGGHGIAIEIGGIRVRPGDLVAADDNGVVVVPRDAMREALRLATELARAEARIKRWIAAGIDPIEAHARARYEPPVAGAAGSRRRPSARRKTSA